MTRSLLAGLLAILILMLAAPDAGAQQELREPTQEELESARDLAKAPDAPAPVQDISGKHTQWRADFIERSYEWHLFSTRIIFWAVLFVVAFGLVVSWQQFRKDISNSPRSSGEKDDSAYDVSASLQSFSVKSKTIGALILMFSATFFFLYLSIVYPINDPSRQSVVGNAE